MKAIVRYKLSETGRKAALLAGLPADAVQNAEVGNGAPEFKDVVAAGSISGDTLLLDTTNTIGGWGPGSVSPTSWDHIPTIQEILDDETSRLAKSNAQVAAKEEATRQNVLNVFIERRITTRTNCYGYGATAASYETHRAAWEPTDAEAIRMVPEVAEWVAELAAANEVVKNAAEQEHLRLKGEIEAAAAKAKEEAAKVKAERRAARGLEDDDLDYDVENDCLMRVPCYDTGRRSKNWMAVVTIDPSKPGGLDRDFAEKAHGDAYYHLPSLSPGDAIEFGADSYSSRGRKTPEREYRYVVRVEVTDGNGYIVMRKASSGKDAVKSGQKFAETLVTA